MRLVVAAYLDRIKKEERGRREELEPPCAAGESCIGGLSSSLAPRLGKQARDLVYPKRAKVSGATAGVASPRSEL